MTLRRLSLVKATAVAGWLITSLGGVLGLWLHVANGAPIVVNSFDLDETGMVGFVVLGVGWASVGALLMIRRPDNVIGRYMIAVGAGYSLSILTATVTFGAVAAHDEVLAGVAGWWTVLLSSIGLLILYLGFIFPTGHGHTLRWDAIGRLVRSGTVVMLALLLLQPGHLHLFPTIDNPFGLGPDLRVIFGTSISPAVAVFAIVTPPLLAASMTSRYRVAGAVQRQQIKWAIAALVLSYAALLATTAIAGAGNAIPLAPLTIYAISGTLVPLAIGVAILRHHLFEIDRIISRTIGYALVTAILAGVFLATNLGLQTLVAAATGASTVAVAASTLLVAALFQPLRRTVQTPIDRRFNRARVDAERTLAAFGDRVRDEVDLSRLGGAVVETADEAVRPTAVGLWLRGVTQ